MRRRTQVLWLSSLMVAAMAMTSCGKPDESGPAGKTNGGKTNQAKVSDFALSAAPAGAKGVSELKASAAKGDEVVIRGIIGGRGKPFVEGAAMVTIVDTEFVGPCDKCGSCKTPWDYCCSDKTELAAAMATVQVVDADGRPLVGTLKGVAGLEPLAIVTVRGTVAEVEPGKLLVISATGAHVEPRTAPEK